VKEASEPTAQGASSARPARKGVLADWRQCPKLTASEVEAARPAGRPSRARAHPRWPRWRP
jgi:hypothetical protein